MPVNLVNSSLMLVTGVIGDLYSYKQKKSILDEFISL